MTPEEFAAERQNCTATPSGWTASCPAHDDRKASLSIAEGAGGKTLLKCFAGCDFPSIAAAAGVPVADLMGNIGTRRELPKPAPERIDLTALARDKALPVALLEELGCSNLPGGGVAIHYRDQHGREVTTRLRYALNAGNGSRWPKGAKPRPYGLDRLKAARKAGWCVLVEGESDAWTLWRHDFPALGIPGADMAGKLEAEHLEGIPALVLIQEPDKGGATFRAGIAARLKSLGWAGELRAVPMKDHGHKDPNAWHKADPEGFREAFGAALATSQVVDLDAPGPAVVEVDEHLSDPEPLPDSLSPVPALNPALLPGPFRAWLEDCAERMQAPLDFFGCAALVALAGVVGRQLAIRPRLRDDWAVVPNLWGAVVAPPGWLKSPALEEMFVMNRRLEAEAGEAYAEALKAHGIELQLAKSRERTTQKKVDAAVAKGNDSEARRLLQKREESTVPPPVRTRYYLNNFTVEALGEVLRDNPRGVLAYRDELRGLLTSLDAEEAAEARAFLVQCWNGKGSYTWDRIGRGNLTSTTCCSLFGGVQPGPLREYIGRAVRGGASDDGLLQRLQVTCWPDFPGTWRDVDRWPDSTAKNQAVEVFRRLDRIDPAIYGANTDVEVPWVRFAPAAFEVFADWRAALEKRLRANEEHPFFIGHLSKYRSLFPSIALLWHLVEGTPGPVGERAAVAALAWVGYLEAHAARLYSPALAPGAAAARELERHLAKGDLANAIEKQGGFTARNVYRNQWRALDRAGTSQALDLLEDLGRVVSFESDGGGRRTTLYRQHPALGKGAAR